MSVLGNVMLRVPFLKFGESSAAYKPAPCKSSMPQVEPFIELLEELKRVIPPEEGLRFNYETLSDTISFADIHVSWGNSAEDPRISFYLTVSEARGGLSNGAFCFRSTSSVDGCSNCVYAPSIESWFESLQGWAEQIMPPEIFESQVFPVITKKQEGLLDKETRPASVEAQAAGGPGNIVPFKFL